jgi:toxin secretion/phage lysis holin
MKGLKMETNDLINTLVQNADFRDGNWVLIVPSVLMAIDFLTGVFDAWATGHLKSFKMREGLNHKVGELAILFMGELFTYGMQLPKIFINCVSLYVIFMEVVSITENLDKMGVPIPKIFKKALRNASYKLENDDNPLKKKDKPTETEEDDMS